MNCKLGVLLVALCLSACGPAYGDSVKDELNRSYKKHVLALRTPFTQDKLKYDSAGQPVNARPSGQWLIYGGIYVEKLGLSKETMRLEGHRVGFSDKKKDGHPILISLGKGVSIEIKLDQPLQ